MAMIIGNPLGFWFLLGIPAILIIHLIQPKPIKIDSSTNIFWQIESENKTRVKNISRIKYSLTLLLQLLAVLLLTYIALEPRWLVKNSRQRIFVVLDNSFSMQAFLPEVKRVLVDQLAKLESAADHTEWILSATAEKPEILYSGESLSKFLKKIENWQPQLGTHNIYDSLSAFKKDCQDNCHMIFVSDHVQEVPEKVELLSLGRKIDNVGFLSSSPEDGELQLAIKNYSKNLQRRKYSIAVDENLPETKDIELAADSVLKINVKLPSDYKKILFSLSPDEFRLDDYLPIVPEEKKELKAYIRESQPFLSFVNKLLKTLPQIKVVDYPEEADLLFLNQNNLNKYENHNQAKMVFTEDAVGARTVSYEPIFSELNYLTEDLSWQGLLLPTINNSELLANQKAVLWQASRALIIKQANRVTSDLHLKFDIRSSNAKNFPAFIILLTRFIESCRKENNTYTKQNFYLSQNITLNSIEKEVEEEIENLSSTKKERRHLTKVQLGYFKAPEVPSFFTLKTKEEEVLRGSTQFYDLAEADFNAAETKYDLSKIVLETKELNSYPDPWESFWIILLMILLLASWHTAQKV